MSQKQIVAETKAKLEALEQRIHAARLGPTSSDGIVSQAHQDWNDMVDKHADIRRRLEATHDPSADAIEGISLDLDVLRNSFERWMSRVEGKFSKGR